MKWILPLAFIFFTNPSQSAIRTGPLAGECPKTPADWEKMRVKLVHNLLTVGQPAALDMGRGLKSCGMGLDKVNASDGPAERCMKDLVESVAELAKPLADDAELKYTGVPEFLLDPELVDLLNRKELGKAVEYLQKVVAKKPGVPPLVVDAFVGSATSPGGGEDRLVIKFTDSSGTTKWVNFDLAGKTSTTAANNVSVVAHSSDGHSYFQDFQRSVDDGVGGKKVKLTRRTRTKDCMQCHIQGYNSIPYASRVQWSGLNDHPTRAQSFSSLHAVKKGSVRPMAADGKPIDIKKFGPAVDIGENLPARRTDAFMNECMNEVIDPMQDEDALSKRRARIRGFMNCGFCHNSSKFGALPFPFGIALGKDLARFHLKRIEDGTMPADDYASELNREDREILAACLFKEQYGFVPFKKGTTEDQVKTGRFYQHFAKINCETGKHQTPASSEAGGTKRGK